MDKIDHVGIAVNSLSSAVPVYRSILGQNPDGYESVPSEGVRIAFFGPDSGRLELLEPTDAASPVARFLRSRGPGLHHVCLSVEDLEAALARLAADGILPVPPGVRHGAGGRRVAFLHPRDAGGTLIELAERAAPPTG